MVNVSPIDLVMCMDCGQRRMTTEEFTAHHCPPGKCHAIDCDDTRHVEFAPAQSRSMQKRLAIMRGEPMPTFVEPKK